MFSDTRSAILSITSVVISLIISINLTHVITAWLNGAIAVAAKFLMMAFFVFPLTLVAVFVVVLTTCAALMAALETAYLKIKGAGK